MRYLFVFLCSILAHGLAAQTPLLQVKLDRSWEQQQHWAELNELDGRFRLLSPAELTHAIDTIATDVGPLVYHTFHLQAPDRDAAENVIYAISYVDYPAEVLHQDSTELIAAMLTAAEEEAAAAVGGDVIYATDRQLGSYPGRQWRIDYPSKGGTASARTLAGVARNRYYEIKVFSLRAAGLNDSADRFFDSVRVF